MDHLCSDAHAARSRIESNSLVKKRLSLINLIKLSQFGVSLHSVAVDAIEFKCLSVVVSNLEVTHVDGLTAE